MRRTRRGCFTGREPKYIWYVYASQGGAMIGTVASDTMDYPINGEQGGYWYVMMKGEYVMYVWDVFNIAQILTGYEMNETAGGTVNIIDGIGSYINWYNYYAYSKSYTFNTQTGLFDLINGKTGATIGGVGDPIVKFSNNCEDAYFAVGTSRVSITGLTSLYYNAQSYEPGAHGYVFTYEKRLIRSPIYTSGKGDATGTIVESYDQSAYPQDGIQGDYWYTYSHSYDYVFDNR